MITFDLRNKQRDAQNPATAMRAGRRKQLESKSFEPSMQLRPLSVEYSQRPRAPPLMVGTRTERRCSRIVLLPRALSASCTSTVNLSEASDRLVPKVEFTGEVGGGWKTWSSGPKSVGP